MNKKKSSLKLDELIDRKSLEDKVAGKKIFREDLEAVAGIEPEKVCIKERIKKNGRY